MSVRNFSWLYCFGGNLRRTAFVCGGRQKMLSAMMLCVRNFISGVRVAERGAKGRRATIKDCAINERFLASSIANYPKLADKELMKQGKKRRTN